MSENLCVTCGQRGRQRKTTPGYRTCDGCCDRLKETLREVQVRYLRLCSTMALLPTTGDEGRKPSGFASQSPARDRVIAMLDSRTVALNPGDPHSVLGILACWADLVRESTNQNRPQPPVTVAREVALLDAWMDFLTRQDWIVELDRELRQVRDQLRSETGEPNPKPIGYCINTLDEGDRTRDCRAPLFAPKTGTALRCQHCGRIYDGLDLVKLELAQETR